MVDLQTILNFILGGFGALSMWIMNNMAASLRELKAQDAQHTKQINKLEVLVAGEYLKREEFDRHIEKMYSKLDELADILRDKADRK